MPIPAQNRTLIKTPRVLARYMHINYYLELVFENNRGEQSKNYGSILLLCQECK